MESFRSANSNVSIVLPPLFANLSANLANFVVVPPVIDLSSCIRHQGPSRAYRFEINPIYLFRRSTLHLQSLLHEIFNLIRENVGRI